MMFYVQGNALGLGHCEIMGPKTKCQRLLSQEPPRPEGIAQCKNQQFLLFYYFTVIPRKYQLGNHQVSQ
jgi:hypothetical protein